MPRAIRAGLMAALVFAAACGADETVIPPPTEANVVGTYNLSIVNGGSLPFPFGATASYRIDIVAGHITLNADRSFTDVLVSRKTFLAGGSDPDDTSTLAGTWTLTGNTLSMAYTGQQQPLPATVTGDQLSRNDQGLALTYSK